jgi:hypothetical protein
LVKIPLAATHVAAAAGPPVPARSPQLH